MTIDGNNNELIVPLTISLNCLMANYTLSTKVISWHPFNRLDVKKLQILLHSVQSASAGYFFFVNLCTL